MISYNFLDGTLNGWIIAEGEFPVESNAFGHYDIQCNESGYLYYLLPEQSNIARWDLRGKVYEVQGDMVSFKLIGGADCYQVNKDYNTGDITLYKLIDDVPTLLDTSESPVTLDSDPYILSLIIGSNGAITVEHNNIEVCSVIDTDLNIVDRMEIHSTKYGYPAFDYVSSTASIVSNSLKSKVNIKDNIVVNNLKNKVSIKDNIVSNSLKSKVTINSNNLIYNFLDGTLAPWVSDYGDTASIMVDEHYVAKTSASYTDEGRIKLPFIYPNGTHTYRFKASSLISIIQIFPLLAHPQDGMISNFEGYNILWDNSNVLKLYKGDAPNWNHLLLGSFNAIFDTEWHTITFTKNSQGNMIVKLDDVPAITAKDTTYDTNTKILLRNRNQNYEGESFVEWDYFTFDIDFIKSTSLKNKVNIRNNLIFTNLKSKINIRNNLIFTNLKSKINIKNNLVFTNLNSKVTLHHAYKENITAQGNIFDNSPMSPPKDFDENIIFVIDGIDFDGLFQFNTEDRGNDVASTFGIAYPSDEELEIISGKTIRLKEKNGDPDGFYNGIIQDVKWVNKKPEGKMYNITGRSFASKLTTQTFGIDSSTNAPVTRTSLELLDMILVNTDVTIGPCVNIFVENIVNQNDAFNGFSGNWNTKAEALTSLLALISKLTGNNVNWFVDAKKLLHIFYTDIPDSTIGIVIRDNNPRVLSIETGDNSENIINDQVGKGGGGSIPQVPATDVGTGDIHATVITQQITRPVAYRGEIETIGEYDYQWDGTGRVYIASSADADIGSDRIYVDDKLIISNASGVMIDYTSKPEADNRTTAPIDITSLLCTGVNTLTIKIQDVYGTTIGCEPLYITKGTITDNSTAPEPDPNAPPVESTYPLIEVHLQDQDSINGYTDPDTGVKWPGFGIMTGAEIQNSSINNVEDLTAIVQNELYLHAKRTFTVTITLSRFPDVLIGQPLYLPDHHLFKGMTFVVTSKNENGTGGNRVTTITATTDRAIVGPLSDYEGVKAITKHTVQEYTPVKGIVTEVGSGNVITAQPVNAPATINVINIGKG